MMGKETNREAAKSATGEANGLPPGWVWTTLGQVSDVTRRRRHPQEYPDLPYIGMEHVEAHTMKLLGTIPASELKSSAEHFEPGDVLYGRLRPYLNKVHSPRFEGLCSPEFIVFRRVPGLVNRYLQYFLNSTEFVAFASRLNAGDRPRVNFDQLADYPFPLPSEAEQRRIVKKLDEFNTRLDAGVASLNRVQAALKRYRAAVLKAACEGRLVPQDPTDEPAAQLLERILAERRARWAAALRAKGKDPAKATYEEPQAPDTVGLPALPEGWCWATVEQVCDRIVDCLHSTPTFTDHGYYCLDSNWIKPGRILYEDARFVDETTFIDRNRRMVPRANDVVFSREGARLGVAVRVPAEFEFCLGQRMMIFRLSGCVESSYFESFLNSKPFQAQYAPLITGTASPHLNIGDIRGFLVPLPPFSEQHRISDDVERRLTILESLKTAIGLALLRADRLRQAVLQRAFEGRLVPLDSA
jgi:type I restriction enzyme S subunit